MSNPHTEAELLDLQHNHPKPGVRMLAEECLRLRTFASEVLHRGCWDPGSGLDGSDLQDLAVSNGLVRRVVVDGGPCHPNQCVCAEVGEPPYHCYRLTWAPTLPNERPVEAPDART